MGEQNPFIQVIIHGQEIEGAIVNDGSGVNVISKTTYDRLGITKWEACPLWLRMADTSTVRPIGLLRQLDVVLAGAYPLLLRRPWLKTANIKQTWNHNILTFRKGKTKIRVSTQNKITTIKQCLLVHTEVVNMITQKSFLCLK